MNNQVLEVKLNFEIKQSEILQDSLLSEFRDLEGLLNQIDGYQKTDYDHISFVDYQQRSDSINSSLPETEFVPETQNLSSSGKFSVSDLLSSRSTGGSRSGPVIAGTYSKMSSLLERLREITEEASDGEGLDEIRTLQSAVTETK